MNVSFKLFFIVVTVFIWHPAHQKLASATPSNVAKRAVTETKYSTKYDNFDVEGVLASSRLLKKYCDCLLDRGSCPPEGRFLKERIPDAIQTQCSKCSEVQKKQVGRVLHHLLLHHRELFLEICDKYDPDGKARKMYGIDEDASMTEDYSEYDEA